MKLVNLALLGHPWNWLVIGLLTILWMMFLAVAFPQSTGDNEDVAS